MYVLSATRCRWWQVLNGLQSSREMKNLASMTAIISALNSPPIRRLTESWKLVAQEKSSQLTSCSLTCAPNNHFAMVWMTLACLDPPGVPFLGETIFVILIPIDSFSDPSEAFREFPSTQKHTRRVFQRFTDPRIRTVAISALQFRSRPGYSRFYQRMFGTIREWRL